MSKSKKNSIENPGDLHFYDPNSNDEFSIKKDESDNTWIVSGNINLNLYELDAMREYLNKLYYYEKQYPNKSIH